MKLWIMSDLHVDIYRYQPPAVEADVVILAGDIAEGDAALRWIEQALPGRTVLFVPGNHEYYRLTVASGDALFAAGSSSTRHDPARHPAPLGLAGNRGYLDHPGHQRALNPGASIDPAAGPDATRVTDWPPAAGHNDGAVIFMQQREWQAQGVRFLGCTLWTDFLLFGAAKAEEARRIAGRVMADFSCINNDDGGKFSVDDSIALHHRHLAWLTDKLLQPFDGPTVVITHHGPARPSLHAKYGDDPVSAGFINDLEHLMGKAALWVHGHTHTPFDYTLHGTRVVCNPRGYVTKRRGEENPLFDPALVIEI